MPPPFCSRVWATNSCSISIVSTYFEFAPRDANFALDYVKQHATTPELREQVCDALRVKCSILWAMLDALHSAYVEPGMIPPGAFDPADHNAAA